MAINIQQILSLGGLEFFSESCYQSLVLSISVFKWSLEEARSMAYFQLCLPPVYTDNSWAAVTVIAELLAGRLQIQNGGVPESIQSASHGANSAPTAHKPLTVPKRCCLILSGKQYLEPCFHVHYLDISQNTMKRYLLWLADFFCLFFSPLSYSHLQPFLHIKNISQKRSLSNYFSVLSTLTIRLYDLRF